MPRRRLSWRSTTQEADARTEAFRVLRSNLELNLLELERRSILVTSANAEEGKTSTTTNLAVAFANAGRRVVVVDLDLRHPDVHGRLEAHNQFGVTDVLLERMTVQDALQYVELPATGRRAAGGIYVMATGPAVSNPAELLGTSRTARLIDSLAEQADVVLLDAAPVLPVADTLGLARHAGGVLFVVEARGTTYPQMDWALGLLSRNQARLLGVVLNRAELEDRGGAEPYGYVSDLEPVP